MTRVRTSGQRALQSWVRRASLTIKLTVIGTAVTAAVVIAAIWALSVETRRSARAMFAQELARHQRALVQLQRQRLSQLIASTSVLTQSPTLRSAMSTYRLEASLGGAARPDLVATVERELERLRESVGSDLVLVTNESGRVFAAAGSAAPAARKLDLSGMAAVRAALDRDLRADSGAIAIYRDTAVTYQLAVYPLTLDGYSMGTLLVGERLDDGLVASARATFDGDVAVTAGTETLLGSAFGQVPALAAARAAAAAGQLPLVEVNGAELVFASLPLGETQRGEPVTLWLIEPLDRTVRSLTAPLFRDFALYGAIAVLLAAAGSALAVRSALRPLNAFVGHLRTEAIAEPTRRFDATEHPAEVRSVNDSVNVLMDAVAAKQAELARRSTELTAANAVLRDEIRERERVEHALGEREEQLRQAQKLEAIGTLAGGIAHDFNNLLTAMSGFTQLALMNADPRGPVAEDLRHVIEAADRAGHLTKQLLAFSRKQVLQPSVLDVAAVVHGVAPLFDRLLGEHIVVRVDAPDTLPRIFADRSQLEQVIVNLAINARDAMPRGGRLTIGVATEDREGSPCVVIRVSDTGTGIPPAIRDRIFEPFFTTKEPGKGTGLGLATVYGIVRQSGGTIELESEVGSGTTFTIRWPTVRDSVATGVVEAPDDEWPRGSETVLLVEDDAAVRTLARRTLESCGYTVLPASDPVEALQLVTTARIDCIVSDMVMPHMNGVQMVESFLAEHPAAVVVFMSGYLEDGLRAEAGSIGSAFLRKPFAPAVLARAVRDALDATRRATPVAL